MKITTKKLTMMALLTALYVVLTFLVAPFSYGQIQFRISEILTLLCFYNPIYVISITIGAFITNLASPLGIIDIVIGSLHSLISCYAMTKVKDIRIASLFPALFSFIIGFEIAYVEASKELFIPATLWVMLSEFIIVSIIGLAVFKVLEKNPSINKFLKEDL